jgi:hypothetical protein
VPLWKGHNSGGIGIAAVREVFDAVQSEKPPDMNQRNLAPETLEIEVIVDRIGSAILMVSSIHRRVQS